MAITHDFNQHESAAKPQGEITLYEITEMMIRYGGSFAATLGELFRRADPQNEARLLTAFPELITEYREMAVLVRMRQARQA